MIIPVVGLVLLLSPVLLGGRLRRYARLAVRRAWVLPLALLAQVVTMEVIPEANHAALSTVHIATYAAAAYFVWCNRAIPGLQLISLGAFSNALAITVNGGQLPASRSALARAGLVLDPDEFLNSGVLPHPRLAFLGDVFAVPAGWPFANVFSVGDVLILLGVGWAAHRICGSRLVPAWEPADTPTGTPRAARRAAVPAPPGPAGDPALRPADGTT